MVVNNFEDCFGNEEAQGAILPRVVEDLEHPEDGGRVDNFVLVFGLVLDVEVNHVEEQVQDATVLRVQQRLEDKHEELFIQSVKGDFPHIALILNQINAESFLLRLCQVLLNRFGQLGQLLFNLNVVVMFRVIELMQVNRGLDCDCFVGALG